MTALRTSGLEANAVEIHIGVNGTEMEAKSILEYLPDKAKVHPHGVVERWEFGTLNLLKRWADAHPDFYVFYHHSKGVTDPNSSHKEWHRRIMQKELIQEWRRCCIDLDRGFQICGRHWEPDLRKPYVPGPKFFVGNFWWTTTRWISFLNPLPSRGTSMLDRLLCEWWVGSVPWKPIIMDYAYPERSQQFIDVGWIKG